MAENNEYLQYAGEMYGRLNELTSLINMAMNNDKENRDYLVEKLDDMKKLCEKMRTAAENDTPSEAPARRAKTLDINQPGKYRYEYAKKDGTEFHGEIESFGQNKFVLKAGSSVSVESKSLSESAIETKGAILSAEGCSGGTGVLITKRSHTINKGPSTLCTIVFGYSTSFAACRERFTKID